RTGTLAATGRTCDCQQSTLTQLLESERWNDAARLLCGVGSFASQWERSLACARPPNSTTLLAPVPRTASSSVCIPAAANGTSAQGLVAGAVLPFSQQAQLLVNGSL